jgi:hypothetical protein
MAVYQGVRLRSTALPVARAAQVARPAVRSLAPASRTVRQAWRVRPAAALLGVILTGTLVALLYLTQTLATTAVSVEISRLEGEIQQLERDLQTYQVFVRTESSTSLVTGWAEDEGLAQLRPPIQVPVP